MLSIKQLVILITLISLALGVMGCERKLPVELTSEIEKIVGKDKNGNDFKLGFVPLIDSKTGQAKYLLLEDSLWKGQLSSSWVGEHFDKPIQASKIYDITTVSVVGVSGIEVDGTKYNSCNFIYTASQKNKPINGTICQDNKYKYADFPVIDKTSEIPTIPNDLTGRLAKIGGIDNLGFLILNDIATGETKLLIQENYVSLPVSLPQEINALTSSNSWNIITYWQNPCCSCTNTSTGDSGCGCAKWLPKCPS